MEIHLIDAVKVEKSWGRELWCVSDRPGFESDVAGRDFRSFIKEFGQDIFGYKLEGFPLLIKIIEAKEDLSLQVHPGESGCSQDPNAQSKNEMWHVLEAGPESHILAGFRDTDLTGFFDSLQSPYCADYLNTYSACAGDSYYIPAGTVHAIGGGTTIYEVQQNSDTTYRLSDWGRVGLDGNPRDLHIEEGKEVTLMEPSQHRIPYQHSRSIQLLTECPYFKCELIEADEQMEIANNKAAFLTCISDSLEICLEKKITKLSKFQTALIPYNCNSLTVRGRFIMSGF